MEQTVLLKNRHSFRFLEIVFLVCFLLGIVAANLYGKGRLEQYGIINTCFIQQLKYVHVSKIDFLIYIISIRIPVIFLLLVLGMTSLYRIVHGAFPGMDRVCFRVSMCSGNQQFGNWSSSSDSWIPFSALSFLWSLLSDHCSCTVEISRSVCRQKNNRVDHCMEYYSDAVSYRHDYRSIH